MLINNIKYWNINGKEEKYDFSDENSLEGQFISYEDGWFEGITKNKTDKEEIFIFGTLIPDEKIELLQIYKNEINKPSVFVGLATEDGYIGKFSIIDPEGVNEFNGISYIETKLNKEQNNIYELQNRIECYLNSMMKDGNVVLYRNYLNIRAAILKKFKKDQHEDPFTAAETSQFLKILQIITE